MSDRLGFAQRKKRFIPRLAYGAVGLGLSVIPVWTGGCGDSESDQAMDASTDAVYPAIDDFTEAGTDAVEAAYNEFDADDGSDAGDAADSSDANHPDAADASHASDSGDANLPDADADADAAG